MEQEYKPCEQFMVARPDDPFAEPTCFKCHVHRHLHTDALARELNKVEAEMNARPIPYLPSVKPDGQ
jgi:hypothetical protein